MDYRPTPAVPLVTEWILDSPERRNVEVSFGRLPTEEDVWTYDGNVYHNIVVVTLQREVDMAMIFYSYPNPEEVIIGGTESLTPSWLMIVAAILSSWKLILVLFGG